MIPLPAIPTPPQVRRAPSGVSKSPTRWLPSEDLVHVNGEVFRTANGRHVLSPAGQHRLLTHNLAILRALHS